MMLELDVFLTTASAELPEVGVGSNADNMTMLFVVFVVAITTTVAHWVIWWYPSTPIPVGFDRGKVRYVVWCPGEMVSCYHHNGLMWTTHPEDVDGELPEYSDVERPLRRWVLEFDEYAQEYNRGETV